MKFIIGKKLAMTQIWLDEKKLAITPVKFDLCVVSQIKTKEKDSYQAIQIATGNRKKKNINKAQLGHFKNLNIHPEIVKEFRVNNDLDVKLGQVIDPSSFEVSDIVDVSSKSKGKGFQGVVKRHGFAGGNKTHGNKDQLRMPGSIGSAGAARVFKGMRMPGRMGNENVTIKNLEIVKIDLEKNIIYIKGAIPGAVNSYVVIKGKGDLKFKDNKKVEEKKEEEIKLEEQNKEDKLEKKEDKKVEKKEEKKPEKEVKDNKKEEKNSI